MITRWDQIVAFIRTLIEHEYLIPDGGDLYLHPIVAHELLQQNSHFLGIERGTIDGHVFEIKQFYGSCGNKDVMEFYTKDNRRYSSGDIYKKHIDKS